MQRTILTIAILILLGLGGWLVFAPDLPSVSDGNDAENGAQNGDRTDGTNSGDQSWETFESGETGTGWRFSIDHPPEVAASEVNDRIYEFKLIGPASEANTEITDGFYISLQLLPDAELATYSELSEAVGGVSITTFKDHPARRYQTESELGSITDHLTFVLENGNSTLVDIGYTTYADDDGGYQETVDAMLATLAFEHSGAVTLDDRIRLTAPGENALVSSPLSIEGEARGTWYFEASFPVVLTNWDGRIIAEHYAEAEGEWMTGDFVPFSATLEFESPYNAGDPDFMQRGSLILQRANPSGLPENDAALEIPVRFAP